jgi:inorganic pyrophosphatase
VDAYLLDWDGPMCRAEGVVTAVVLRGDDVEDKLVVVHSGAPWADAGIMKALWFQEQYFLSRLVR